MKYTVKRCRDVHADGCPQWRVYDENNMEHSFHCATRKEAEKLARELRNSLDKLPRL